MKRVDDLHQASLFAPTSSKPTRNNRNGAGFSDPSFAVNKSAPVHRWIPWIAGFSKDFVREAIERHLYRPGVVLDPFAGVGTTLVEALLAGHGTIGFEINPYAALASKAKIAANCVNLDELKLVISTFEESYTRAVRDCQSPKTAPPEGFSTRAEFYSPPVLRKVLLAQDFIWGLPEGAIRNLCALAFASTMVTYSNYSYEPSLSRRISAGKKDVLDFNVIGAIVAKLQEMVEDIAWLHTQVVGAGRPADVHNTSFFNCREVLKNGGIDLVVTSPPYLNNYHYNRNTRPQMYWLGFAQSPSDFRQLEQDNFGKYWQVVRDRARIDLEFPAPPREICECLDMIRERNPEKGIYGGNGWANYAATYFNDCYKFAALLRWSLKRRGTALIVIGNNILQGIVVPTDRFLGMIAERAGMELVDIHIPRESRVGSSIIQSSVRVAQAPKSEVLYEAVVELRKR